MKRKTKIGVIIAIMLFAGFNILFPYLFEIIVKGTVNYEEIYYRSQIVSSIFVMFGVIVAIWQYVLSVRSENETRRAELQLHEKEIVQMECDRVQKAIDLANYYKDEILDKFSVVLYVFQKVELVDILSDVNQSEMRNFDTREFERLFSLVQRKEIEKRIKSEELIQAIIETEMIFGEELHLQKYAKVVINEDNGEREIVFNAQGIHKQFMSDTVSAILNNLEYFAMHFTHKTADESVVFQSLHQTYLQIVQMLYYNIAKHNKGNSKYYTNIIELYEIWYKKSEEQNESMSVTTKESIIKGTVAKVLK